MNEDFSDELISAYLDGELTAEEQTRVEQLLMDSRQHRQTFEELRALRSRLQALPSYQLDDGFADRVLRRAERAMLTESLVDAARPSAAHEKPIGSDDVQPESSKSAVSARSQPGNWRVALIAVPVVAAALVISIAYFPLMDPSDNVRVARQEEEADHGLTRSTQPDAAAGLPHFAHAETESTATPKPQSSVIDAYVDGDQSRATGSSGAAAGQSESRRRMMLEKQMFGGDRGAWAPSEQADSRASTGDEMKEQSRDSSLPTAAGKDLPQRFAARSADAPATPMPTDPAVVRDLRVTGDVADSEALAAGRYVVMVDFAREAFEQKVFDQALGRNGIVLNEQLVKDVRDAAEGDAAALDLTGAGRKGIEISKWGQNKTTDVSSGDLDVIVVEAPSDRIQATCAELSRTGQLVAMTVHREAGQDDMFFDRQLAVPLETAPAGRSGQKYDRKIEDTSGGQSTPAAQSEGGGRFGGGGAPTGGLPAPMPSRPLSRPQTDGTTRLAETLEQSAAETRTARLRSDVSSLTTAERGKAVRASGQVGQPWEEEASRRAESEVHLEVDSRRPNSGFAFRIPAPATLDDSEANLKRLRGVNLQLQRRTHAAPVNPPADDADRKKTSEEAELDMERRPNAQRESLGKAVEGSVVAAEIHKLPSQSTTIRVVFIIRPVVDVAGGVDAGAPARGPSRP